MAAYGPDDGTTVSKWPADLHMFSGANMFAGATVTGHHVGLVPHDASHAVRLAIARGDMTAFPSAGAGWPSGFVKGARDFVRRLSSASS